MRRSTESSYWLAKLGDPEDNLDRWAIVQYQAVWCGLCTAIKLMVTRRLKLCEYLHWEEFRALRRPDSPRIIINETLLLERLSSGDDRIVAGTLLLLPDFVTSENIRESVKALIFSPVFSVSHAARWVLPFL